MQLNKLTLNNFLSSHWEKSWRRLVKLALNRSERFTEFVEKRQDNLWRLGACGQTLGTADRCSYWATEIPKSLAMFKSNLETNGTNQFWLDRVGKVQKINDEK